MDQAIREGLRILVFEQTEGQPFGLSLEETSTRLTFAANPGHVALKTLQSADLRDLRGQSDLIAPYPDAPPETRSQWPARCFKWSNRGVVATYVYQEAALQPVPTCLGVWIRPGAIPVAGSLLWSGQCHAVPGGRDIALRRGPGLDAARR